MAVNEQGYIRPTYDELLESSFELARELFGEDIDTTNSSPLGKYIRLLMQDLADAYEAQEVTYYSRFPNTATGQSLDRLMPFAGITRNPPTRAEHEIKFYGVAGSEIPVGFLVGTIEDEQFYLANPLTLDENGEGTGIVQCTEFGTIGNVQLGSITEIINPSVSVSSIEHTDIVTIGEEEESDADLRERFAEAIEGSGASGTAEAVINAVMRVTGVKSCMIVENQSDKADSEGRPPHSFEVYVYAPESAAQDIGEAIFSQKPLGIKSYGDVSVSVLDVSGDTQTVCFSRVAEIRVLIKATVAKDALFELDGIEQIKTALISYVGGLSTGEDVVFTSLYKYIFGITGVKDVPVLSISNDEGANYSSSNITISAGEIATLSAQDIAIEVVDYADK